MRHALFSCLFTASLFVTSLLAPALAGAAWIHEDWDHRVEITANQALIESSETFTDFMLLVALDGIRNPDVFAGARADGNDLLFTLADGTTELDREIVSFDPFGQTAEIWVRVPAFSKTSNGLYLYYAHPDTNLGSASSGTWGAEYRAVYHFEEDPGDAVLLDSSPIGAHIGLVPERNWTSGDVAAGQIGQAWKFNGSSHHLSTNAISTQDESYTLSGWLESTSASSAFFIEANPGFWHLSSQAPPFWTPDYAADGEANVTWTPQPLPQNDGYHHFLWAFDAVSDTLKFYFDGSPRPIWSLYQPVPGPLYTGRLINPTNSEPVGILGSLYFGTEDLHAGGADEYRIREGVVSSARVLTEYRSQADNTAFLAFGDEEDGGGGSVDTQPGPRTTALWLRTNPNPTSGRSAISYSIPAAGRVRIVAYDVAGREVAEVLDEELPAGSWTTRWDGKDGGGRSLAQGVYFLRLQTALGTRSVKVTIVR